MAVAPPTSLSSQIREPLKGRPGLSLGVTRSASLRLARPQCHCQLRLTQARSGPGRAGPAQPGIQRPSHVALTRSRRLRLGVRIRAQSSPAALTGLRPGPGGRPGRESVPSSRRGMTACRLRVTAESPEPAIAARTGPAAAPPCRARRAGPAAAAATGCGRRSQSGRALAAGLVLRAGQWDSLSQSEPDVAGASKAGRGTSLSRQLSSCHSIQTRSCRS